MASSGLAVLLYVAFTTFAAAGLNPLHPTSEGAPLEWLQNLTLGASVVLAARMALDGSASGPRRIWLILLAAFAAFLLGEEISWGQHVFGWPTADWLARINAEGETNLHNLATIGEERETRLLLMIAAPLIAVVWPLARLAARRPLGRVPDWMTPGFGAIPWAIASAVAADAMRGAGFTAGRGLTKFQYGEVQELFLYILVLHGALGLLRAARWPDMRPRKASAAPLARRAAARA